jgi:hypothetical protein
MRKSLTVIALLAIVSLVSRIQAADEPKKASFDDIQGAIPLLSSPDKAKRLAATQLLFKQDRDALAALKKAGAKHSAEEHGTTISTSRRDMVYSLIVGFPPKPTAVLYAPTSFGIHVEKGTTREAVVEMGKKHGFQIVGEFRADGAPHCYVQLTAGGHLPTVMRELLLKEADVVTLNLNYVEQGQRSAGAK